MFPVPNLVAVTRCSSPVIVHVLATLSVVPRCGVPCPNLSASRLVDHNEELFVADLGCNPFDAAENPFFPELCWPPVHATSRHLSRCLTAHDAAALIHARRNIIAACPHAPAFGLEPSHIRPTRASSHLTNFPKQDSLQPTHPYPSIPVVRAPRPHAYESVTSSHARHLIPCAHARMFTP